VDERNWLELFPALQGLGETERRILDTRSRILRLPAGATVFAPGKTPQHMLLLLDGVVRVQQVSAGGREIVLYRVFGGESCIMTTACLLANETYHAEAIAETPLKAVGIARAAFDDLLDRSAAFRRFVFTAYATRIADLFLTIQEVAFGRVDVRLAHKLCALADAGGRIALTHQDLAREIGTAREVVSRQLHEFQRCGWVAVKRGEITIRDRASLAALAAARE